MTVGHPAFVHYDRFYMEMFFGARVGGMQSFIFLSEKVSKLEIFASECKRKQI